MNKLVLGDIEVSKKEFLKDVIVQNIVVSSKIKMNE